MDTTSIEAGIAQGPTFAGEFETHVTVEALDPEATQRFERACAELDVQCVFIELSRGAVRSQPMTSSHCRGNLLETYRSAVAVADGLKQRGFSVTRIKIEAAPENLDIPQTDEQALRLPATNYFEYHLKLVLAADSPLEDLERTCEQHGAHLSRNVFKRRDDGRSERFVTLRCYQMGRRSADLRLSSLTRDLAGADRDLSKTICEYCVFDNNVSVDAEWLEP